VLEIDSADSGIFLNASQRYLYWNDGKIRPISESHSPYFLAFAKNDIERRRKELIDKWKSGELNNVKDIGEIEGYKSFWNPKIIRKVFKVYTTHSYLVPEVSDSLFKMGFYTAEHDIPYRQRVLTDLASQGRWLFDTNGEEKKLKMMAYDIETTQYGERARDIPIDIIGYSLFDISFHSRKDLEKEEFDFEIVDYPDWEGLEVIQLVAHNRDEEIDSIRNFCSELKKVDIVSGHNLLGFDNLQIYNRIKYFLKDGVEASFFNEFLNKYALKEQTFHFGLQSNAIIFYPCSFDTYHASRKFYSLDDYSLKAVAPFLGVNIKDRIYLTPSQMKLDERTMKYNRI
jgi:DNA polymerase elongation subunit (family B)